MYMEQEILQTWLPLSFLRNDLLLKITRNHLISVIYKMVSYRVYSLSDQNNLYQTISQAPTCYTKEIHLVE